jgi:hypothetical protein
MRVSFDFRLRVLPLCDCRFDLTNRNLSTVCLSGQIDGVGDIYSKWGPRQRCGILFSAKLENNYSIRIMDIIQNIIIFSVIPFRARVACAMRV